MGYILYSSFLVLCFFSGSWATNWTILPNSRCHNDVGQTHNISSMSECEAACLAIPQCAIFTYCPPQGAPPDCIAGNGGPMPSTCWFFPISELLTCSADNGWTSGFTALPSPSPPPPPPRDWAARIAAGQMAYTAATPATIGAGWFPVVGNGFRKYPSLCLLPGPCQNRI